jgi:hypothetical protein
MMQPPKRKGKPMTKAQREHRDHQMRLGHANKRIGLMFGSGATPSPKQSDCQTRSAEIDGSFQSSPVAGNSNPDTKVDGN